MIRHHPTETTLFARAAGTLPARHIQVLAVHLAACPDCAASLRDMEAIGGALLSELPRAAMHPDALTQTLARLDQALPAARPPATTLETLATGRWWWIGPGMRLMPLSRRDESGTRLDLIRVAPGVALPAHGHTGAEMACILQGGYADETGAYGLHDIEEGDAATVHTPIALPGPDCVCLIATTGRLLAKTWVARLVQPLIGV